MDFSTSQNRWQILRSILYIDGKEEEKILVRVLGELAEDEKLYNKGGYLKN